MSKLKFILGLPNITFLMSREEKKKKDLFVN